MSRRLVVDGQLFQTPAWHRGMGKYSLELLDGFIAAGSKRGWDSIEILLSSKMRLDPEVSSILSSRLPVAKVELLDLLPNEIGNPTIVHKNRRVVDDYINSTAQPATPTDYLVLSIMQGEITPAFPSDPEIKKILLLYDLIPLMFHDIYLKNPITRVEYLFKLEELFRADMYLAISKTVANDLSLYLGIDQKRIVSIDGGPIDHADKSTPVGVPEPFILMPTGNDLRKNNKRAIMAFEEFNQANENQYSLIITSFFKDHEIAELSQLSANVIFTGNISGQQLRYLYERAEALLFPPEYEGLGLPILEAMEHDKPVACSDISVFREMSHSAFHYFNPYSTTDIKNSLQEIVENPSVDKQAYSKILDNYIWSRTVEKALVALKVELPKVVKSRLRIAIFGPGPSHDNSVGKFMQNNHAELGRHCQADYFIVPGQLPKEVRINFLPYIANQTVAESGMGFVPEDYDAIVYHLSNQEASAPALLAALAVPGVVVLHDINLKRLWQMAVKLGLLSKSRFDLEKNIDHKLGVKSSNYLSSLLAVQKAIIVFDAASQKAIQKLAHQIKSKVLVQLVNLPVNGLVYSETLPDKTTLSRKLPLEREHNRHTEFQETEELSHCLTINTEMQEDYQAVLEAMALGVVPVVPNTGLYSELEDDVAVKVQASDKFEVVIDGLSKDRDRAVAYMRKDLDTIAKRHNQPDFAKQLTELINQLARR